MRTINNYFLAIFILLLPSTAFSDKNNIGIIYVGSSWCTACKLSAPYLASFAQEYNIPILVSSYDNKPIHPFPDFTPLSGGRFDSIRAFPTVLFYSEKHDDIIYAFEGFKNANWFLSQMRKGINKSEVVQ